jgi:hypothetical protein
MARSPELVQIQLTEKIRRGGLHRLPKYLTTATSTIGLSPREE